MTRTYNGRFASPPEPRSGSKWIVGGLLMIPLWSIPGLGLAVLAGSVCCFVKGGKMNRERGMYRRFHEMCAVIGMRTRVPVRELAKQAEMGKGDMRKYLQTMISRGYFGSEAVLDLKRDELVLPQTGKAPEGGFSWRDLVMDFLGALKGEAPAEGASGPAKKPAEPQVQPEPQSEQKPTPCPEAPKKTYMDELEQTLNELYQLNEKIADEAVSRRIDRIGTLTASIFRAVIEKPERAPDVRKFMNYYLPTTLKLLKSYDMLEDQSYQGENIIASRRKIENVLDMLIAAYEKQLDRLFSNDALDIATDIDVLEAMMAGDGLSHKAQVENGGIRLTL